MRDGDKDTVRNIRAGGGFVVNLVSEALLEKMNVCAIDFPPEVDELAAAGLTPVASRSVRAPGIAESPVRLECREYMSIPVGSENRTLIIGEILAADVRDGIVEPETLRVDVDALDLVGRLHGGNWYLRLTDRIRMDRITSVPEKRPGARE
jgi:flavin reductase (DIM6/NTAB) family NADH-FMN oxidoreductase RutF